MAWLHAAVLRDGGFLGAPRSDVLRAVWGLDLPIAALPDPVLWTDYVGFPAGAKVVLLPFLSTHLGSPLTVFFGPALGYTLWILVLLWATGVATAWMTERWAESGAAGLLAGTWIVLQPMLFAAVTDGTAEFVAFWAVPATIAAFHHARTSRPWARAAAVLGVVVALDSPYHAVFLAPFLPFCAWQLPRRYWWDVAGIALVGAALLVGLYYGLPISAPQGGGANAVSLRIWQQWEAGGVPGWDWTLGTGFIPSTLLAGGFALALLRPLRALPWLAVGLLALIWSLGPEDENPRMLARWLGAPGGPLGEVVTWLNTTGAPPVVRFPRRWLVPAALALGAAAGLGLTRVPQERYRYLLALPLAVGAVWVTIGITGYRDHLPHFQVPDYAFARFVREHEGRGAVLFLPRVRGARSHTARQDLPVFAELGKELTSADLLYLQVATRRASVFLPDGLRTIRQRYSFGNELERFLRDLDDLTNPQTTGSPIPPSALNEPERRRAAATSLVVEGLGFVVIDEAIFGADGLARVQEPFAATLVEARHFDDGTGVTVLVVAPP